MKKRGFRIWVPVAMFIIICSAVHLWYYLDLHIGDSLKGYLPEGKTFEAVATVIKDPAVIFTLLGVLFLTVACFAALKKAFSNKVPGALPLTFLLVISLICHFAILYSVVTGLAR
ncbi:MAG: hypothetical protein IJT70_04295 [Clostridia bacterium]|nr:hypothetical protein [Clostridia bacterium]